jgi:predicted enzyme related to lactoylglutathione lyase
MKGRPMTLSWANLFCADIEALSAFYRDLFGFSEIAEARSPIFVALETGASRLGFNAPEARALLGLADIEAAKGVKSMLTFDVESPAEVDRLTALAESRGAKVAKAPYRTYYGAWQSVLLDPEGNVFRINSIR